MGDTLVNIIHPYTLKARNRTFLMGPVPEFEERDIKVAAFVNASLDSGARVVHHRNHPENSVDGALQDGSFIMDPIYEFLYDDRIVSIVTTMLGGPIPTTRPEKVPEDKWDLIRKYYSDDAEFAETVGQAETVFFIGGALEACIANCAAYFNENYRRDGDRLLYIPELCASFDQVQRKAVEMELAERKIMPIGYADAMGLLNRKAA